MAACKPDLQIYLTKVVLLLDTAFSMWLEQNALKHPVQGGTGPVIPWRSQRQGNVAESHLAAVLIKILSQWDGHSGRCWWGFWVLQQLIQGAVQIRCWLWCSWSQAKTSQPLTHLKWIRTFCSVPHAGDFMWNCENEGNYQPWVVTGRCWKACLLGWCLPASAVPLGVCKVWCWATARVRCSLECVGLLDRLTSRVHLHGGDSPVIPQMDNSRSV